MARAPESGGPGGHGAAVADKVNLFASARMPRIATLLILISTLGWVPRADAIIGGQDAVAGEFPGMAGIIRKGVTSGPGLIGGGVLVGDQWVATTAHSLVNLSASQIEVWLGSRDLADASSRVVVQVIAIVRHPDFAIESGTSTHDLALLLLDRRIGSIPAVPVLSDPAALVPGDPVAVAGWGTVYTGQIQLFPRLQTAAAGILETTEAVATFGPILNDSHLAAVDPLGAATPCFGDSGGPLVKNLGGTEVVVGLVSFGTAECDDASKPTIYTRLSTFHPWIGERLAATAVPPRLRVTGRGRAMRTGEAPSVRKGGNFGKLKGRAASRVRGFRMINLGSGWLTVRSVTVSGAGFSLRKPPARLLTAGRATALQVRLWNRSKRSRYRGRVLIRTNQPTLPVYLLRVGGRSV